MVHFRPLLAAALALASVSPGCCWLPFMGEAKNRLDQLVDQYKDAALAQSSCYSMQEPQRSACFSVVNSALSGISASVATAHQALDDCDQLGFDRAVDGIRVQIFGIVASAGNLAALLQSLEMQATGTGSGDMATTVTLGTGAVVSTVFAPGAPTVGPYALSGSFSADLQPAGQALVGPVTALAISAAMPGHPSWQLSLSPSASNQCSLLPPVAGFRNGTLSAFVLIISGNTRWPLLLRMPVRVSADLASWDLSTAGMVPATRLMPLAPAASMRIGAGCPGASGNIPRIRTTSVPRVGDPLRIVLGQARPLSAGLLIVGDSSTTFGGLGLPLDLGTIGAPGCMLRVSPVLLLPVGVNGAGSAELSLPVPSDPSLAGGTVYPQWLVLDPANPLGAVLSGGMQLQFLGR